MLESSLIKLQAFRTPTLLKRDFDTDIFPAKFAKFLRAPCFTSPAAASAGLRFPARNFVKKETPAKMFFCEFYKIFKNIF